MFSLYFLAFINQYNDAQVLAEFDFYKIKSTTIDLSMRTFHNQTFKKDLCPCLLHRDHVLKYIKTLETAVLRFFKTLEINEENIAKYRNFRQLFILIYQKIANQQCIVENIFFLHKFIKQNNIPVKLGVQYNFMDIINEHN